MKKFSFLIALFFVLTTSKITAQADSLAAKPAEKTPLKSDTLFTRSNEKIPCKVLEIGVSEIKYKKANFLEGPTFIIEKSQVDYIIFASGIKDVIQQEQPAAPVYQNNPPPAYQNNIAYGRPSQMPTMQKNRALKFEPIALLEGKIIFGYEQCLKLGFNIEAKFGYVNSTALNQSLNTNTAYIFNGYPSYTKPVVTAGFLKAGIKFTFGQDHRYKGEWYKHPLKGHFLRVNGIVNNIKVHYNQYLYQNLSGGASSYYAVDQAIAIYGFVADYGYQFVLGNSVTLDMYIGMGFASYNRTSNLPSSQNGYYYYSSYNQGSTYYSHMSVGMPNNGTSGLIFNTGFTLGVALR